MARVISAAVVLAGLTALMGPVFAQSQPKVAQRLISIDWKDPEITSFVANRAANPPRSVKPQEASALRKLQLPVLAFDVVPTIVRNTIGVQAKASRPRQIFLDEENPVWYHIVDHYGTMTVTVDADLRVQGDLPDDTPVYNVPKAAVSGAPAKVSIFDANAEEHMEGLIAEYTVLKFNGVPYTVTIECTASQKAECKRADVIGQDQDLLKLIEARPPK